MLTLEQAAIVKGMLARGDKQHDIAAHFGVNPGRIIDVKFGDKFAAVDPVPQDRLPPRGLRLPAQPLIDATMALADQLQVLDELIKTTPPESPSVIIDITPELAREILEHRNNNNRNNRPAKIKRFAEDLTSGLWMVTGDTIKFGSHGMLLDGQNRLRAALISGVTIRTHVVFGVDPVAFKVLDSGAGRTSGDTFQVAGVANAPLAARAVRWLMIAANPRIDRGLSIANSDLFEHYQKRVNKDMLQEQIQRAKRVRSTIPHGTLAALLYMFERKDAQTAAIFAHDLEKELRSARYLLAKLDHLRTQTGSRINERLIVNLTMMTWNAYRSGSPIKRRDQLRWTDDESDVTLQ
jgi:hypothetical protein